MACGRLWHVWQLSFRLLVGCVLVGTTCVAAEEHVEEESSAAQAPLPNIVWIVVEDMSLPFGCYGERTIQTPNVDALARSGVRFERAFVTAPVCSAARSALITGMYQTSIGAHHHRSGRGRQKISLPRHVRLIPQLFREAGYFVCNTGRVAPPSPQAGPKSRRLGKTDYNFACDAAQLYDGAHWLQRPAGKPFFAQFQLRGGKARTAKTPRPVDPGQVRLPPYYPDDPVIRRDWAHYLNAAANTDREVGQILKQLADAGVRDNTYVFFLTDHGISHARGKQFLYDEGIRVPLIVAGPRLPQGTQRADLVVHLDVAATSLALADIPLPGHLQGRHVFAADYQPRAFIVAARDRCDETVDHIRCVRTQRFKYIRNFLPQRPYLQPNTYKDNKEIILRMRKLFAAGQLNAAQSLIMRSERPIEELYDLQSDPWELHNLAADPDHGQTLVRLRGQLETWMDETNDMGRKPESPAMYASDMQVYLDTIKKRKPERVDQILSNMAQMREWSRAGR
jgi:arylsulfatase A-like enzyme